MDSKWKREAEFVHLSFKFRKPTPAMLQQKKQSLAWRLSPRPTPVFSVAAIIQTVSIVTSNNNTTIDIPNNTDLFCDTFNVFISHPLVAFHQVRYFLFHDPLLHVCRRYHRAHLSYSHNTRVTHPQHISYTTAKHLSNSHYLPAM